MRINAENSATGERFEGEAEKLTDEDLRELTKFRIPELAQNQSERKIRDYINNAPLPGVEEGRRAEARVQLNEMSKMVIYVGGKIIHVGRKLLDCVLDALDYACKEYPNTTFGVIFGAIVGVLVATIPVLGVVFGTLAAIIVAIIGFWQDIDSKKLDRETERAKLRKNKNLDQGTQRAILRAERAIRSFENLRTS